MFELINYAQREIERQGRTSPESDYDGELGKVVLDLITVFAQQGHNGYSASMTLKTFNRLSQFKPLSPLTGADDEWTHVTVGLGHPESALWQNKRCPSVFKDGTGQAWDIESIVLVDRVTGDTFTNRDSRKYITFPYTPPDEPELLYSDNKQPYNETLTLDGYQQQAATTAIYPGQGTVQGLVYASLGAAGEVGELCDQVKRILRDDDGHVTLERREKLIKELGDVMWYSAQIAKELGANMSHVTQLNLGKLFDRKTRGVLHGEGNNR